MNPPATSACPGENDAPYPAPGPIDDSETLVRFVRGIDYAIFDGQTFRLSPGSLARDDIKGSRGKDGRERSVSMFRKERTPADGLVLRARASNVQPEWMDEPVVALVQAAALRNIFDAAGRREICVYAEPIDEAGDPNGPCPTHAGVKRSKPDRPNAPRVEMGILRDKIASAFDPLRHLRADGTVGELVMSL